VSKTKENAITTLYACLLPKVIRFLVSARRTLFNIKNRSFTQSNIFYVNFLKFHFQLTEHVLYNVNKFPSQLMQHAVCRLVAFKFQPVHYAGYELNM